MKHYFKLILSTLLLSLAICSFPVFAVTRKEALDYAKSKIGTKVGNGECVFLAKDYYRALFNEVVYGNACTYINNVPEGFTQYLYGEDDWDPQPGDIVSWSWNKYGGNFGHVGIITRVDSTGFYYLDQNPYPVKESRYNYDQTGWTLAGVVRPPFEDDMITETPPPVEESVPEHSPENKPNTLTQGITQIVDQVNSSVQSAVANIKNLESGSYCIISASSGKYMNTYADSVKQIRNGTALNLYKAVNSDKNDTQRFIFKKSAENTYLIQPRNSSYTVNVSGLKADSKVICWTSSKKNNEEWIIEPAGNSNGYTFRLKSQPDMYLTQSGSSLLIKKKSGKTNQIFYIR